MEMSLLDTVWGPRAGEQEEGDSAGSGQLLGELEPAVSAVAPAVGSMVCGVSFLRVESSFLIAPSCSAKPEVEEAGVGPSCPGLSTLWPSWEVSRLQGLVLPLPCFESTLSALARSVPGGSCRRIWAFSLWPFPSSCYCRPGAQELKPLVVLLPPGKCELLCWTLRARGFAGTETLSCVVASPVATLVCPTQDLVPVGLLAQLFLPFFQWELRGTDLGILLIWDLPHDWDPRCPGVPANRQCSWDCGSKATQT
ncbi:hypothetical protein P7K49_032865 [Saguinus oedipus]|uniref:Uncharacterized protein n=1 Tax=Saguinus oedipus TaxID=9490 RepID=A0ABQ9TQA6_SAGOE|nr:hypothetical protein P7K49_032865 [Saguinus oedipus]